MFMVVIVTTVSFHNCKSQNFKLSVSNPTSKYVACLSVLSQISNCQGLGRKNKFGVLKTYRKDWAKSLDSRPQPSPRRPSSKEIPRPPQLQVYVRYMCIYIYIYTCIYIYIYSCYFLLDIYIYIYVYTHTRIYIYIYIYFLGLLL